MIAELIDKQDAVEVIRDQIAAILATESASQVALAQAAGKPDPDLWKLRVYQERSNPWENLPGQGADTSPLVNVWWDNSSFELAGSNIVERQKATGTINIDCYGYGKSADVAAGGHLAGDRVAAEAAQRAVRLARNILMAGEYTYLGLRGVVGRRWVGSISIFQPQQDSQNAAHVVGARLAFRINFNEFSPQVAPVDLELLTAAVHRTEDGQVMINAEWDYLNEDY